MSPAKRKTVTIRARNSEDLRRKVSQKYPSHVIEHVRELTKIFDVTLKPRQNVRRKK